ncbi:hypothetical protein COO60DRAFT_1515373 [Scenedesmus sp. NREL 46B-D3]|nr:hypothetical protein COO60DRAFT_1515373 [Scenedesmus sp. NREL 46B-D3]
MPDLSGYHALLFFIQLAWPLLILGSGAAPAVCCCCRPEPAWSALAGRCCCWLAGAAGEALAAGAAACRTGASTMHTSCHHTLAGEQGSAVVWCVAITSSDI